MRIIMYPYKIYSESAKALQNAFEEEGYRCLRVFSDQNYTPKSGDIVITWGASQEPEWNPNIRKGDIIVDVLNKPQNVCVAINKRRSFDRLAVCNIKVPYHTIDKQKILSLLKNKTIVARTKLESKGGEGIVLVRSPEELVDAKLYVEYIKKKYEYRVHVFKDTVIDVQIKLRKSDWPDDKTNFEIRNLSNGWIFARQHRTLQEVDHELMDLAIDAVAALGLDFGAVDIVHNTKRGYFVLEVNTAPGLEGSTIEVYKNAFLEYINDL